MMEEKELLNRYASLRRETLHIWVERGWVMPTLGRSGYRFREIDVARVRLILEFHKELELDEDSMDIVLSLLDQVHGLRQQLRRLANAVDSQPDDIRSRIAETFLQPMGKDELK